MNIDRRNEMRVPLLLPVECHGFGDETRDSFKHAMNSRDMSPNGMSLRCETPLEPGQPCRFMFVLPHHQEKTEIAGEVRWATGQTAHGRSMGIQFSEPIDFSIPFPVAEKAVRSLRQDVDSHLACLYQAVSDACVWVNPRGEITQYDERFLQLLGCSDVDVTGKSVSDFAHADDRQGLSNLLAEPHTTGPSSPVTGLFRIQPNGGKALFWRIRVLPERLWSTSRAIHIEDMTGFFSQERKKYRLEQQDHPSTLSADDLSLNHLQQILGATATGFLLRDVLEKICDPITCLLAQLDLLRYKLALSGKESRTKNGDELTYYAEKIEEVEQIVKDLSNRFKHMLENTCCHEPTDISRFNINKSLSKAIGMVGAPGGLEGNSITFKRRTKLPITESNEGEFVMIFLVFLLLCQDCLRNVSNKTIRCETERDNGHIIARILHNGHVRQGKYLDMLFHKNPVHAYFFEHNSISFVDTLLYYGNLLLKKNNVRTKVTNIPGHFSLSFLIPAGSQSKRAKKPKMKATTRNTGSP